MTSPAVALPRVSEKQEQQAIIDLIESLGGKVYVLGTRRPAGDMQGTRQTPGIGDLYCFLPGANATAVWIEVKAADGRLSKAQREFQTWCLLAGAVHLVGGIDVTIRWLTQGGWLK